MPESLLAYIGIGSNLGDRRAYCEDSVRQIGQFNATSLIAVSSLYETAPMEQTDQRWFFNCVAAVRTELSPMDLLRACQQTEQALGRTRTVRYGPRTIDLDILFYGNRSYQESALVIPHPRAHERRFVLEPLTEIAPDLMHPILHKTAAQLLDRVRDQEIRPYGPLATNLNIKRKTG